MKIAFDKIKERLEDPFFEAQYLSKGTIKQHTLSIEKQVEYPHNIQFIDWIKEDEQELIRYSFANTEIGRLLIANTSKGICFLGFSCDDDAKITEDFQKRFPRQQFEEQSSRFQTLAVDYCNGDRTQIIPIHLKGTTFQVKIWKKLVLIPEGRLSTYGSLTNDSKASQAVGSAVGANPVSYIIPCHRIVKNDGNFHGYHWGADLKKQLLAYELQI